MRRRDFVSGVAGSAAAWPLAARAQQPARVPTIGFLSLQLARAPGPLVAAFQQGLRELGYVEGVNLAVEWRWGNYRLEPLQALAAELVAQKVNVIVALEPPGARAAIRATSRIPIVIRSTDDPVEQGLVTSLARPGGNVTGVSSESSELHGKRLEFLKKLKPNLKRVAVLWNSSIPNNQNALAALEAAARNLGVGIESIEVPVADRLSEAIATATRGGATGLMLIRNPMFVSNAKRIADLATTHGLLTAFDERQFVEVGGLLSYGTRLADLYRRAATYVDKILKGVSPADIPVQQPTKFELAINLKTAKALGLDVPPTLLAIADEVIE